MYLFLILLWCMTVVGRFGGPNPISRNSRFGGFNSRLGLRKFPVRMTTGIWSQGIDFARGFCGQMAREGAKSTKFPAQREKPGKLQEHLGRVAEEDLADGLVMGVAGLDLLRDGVDVAVAALEGAAGEDRIDAGGFVGPVGDCDGTGNRIGACKPRPRAVQDVDRRHLV